MMDLLKPTDNLHKFMGLGGLFLAICFVILPVLFFHRTSMEYLAQLRAHDEWQVHEKFTKDRLTTLDNRKRQTVDEKNKLQAQLDKLNSGSKAPGNSADVEKLESRIVEVNREIESIEDTSHELSLDLALRRESAKNDEQLSQNRRRDSRVAVVLGMIAAIICSLVSFIGLRWWKRFQGFLIEAMEEEAQLQAKTEADKLEQAKLAQPKLDQGKLDQGKLEQAKLEQTKLEQTKLEQATPLFRHPSK